MDDALGLIAALTGALGVLAFFLGVVMFIWGAATLGVRHASVAVDQAAAESNYWDTLKEILKKSLTVAFDRRRPLADRRIALGFILMIIGSGLLLAALGVAAADAAGAGDSTSGRTTGITTAG